MEIEAKFAIPNRAMYRELNRLRDLAGYTLAPTGTVKVTDRYFDTFDGRLLAAGYACRLRTQGDVVVATLKSLGGVSGVVHRRDEQEVQLAGWTPDPLVWPKSPARALALELTSGAQLQPLFELTQSRACADVLDSERPVAQLSLDAVRAAVGKRPALYYELEVELTETGTEADLTALAGELMTTWKLVPEPRSKFERALATLRQRGTAIEDRLSADERAMLQAYAAGDDKDLARRAAVVLAWAEGLPTREITERSRLSGGRVRHWLRAFRAERMGIFPKSNEYPKDALQASQPTTQPADEVIARPPSKSGTSRKKTRGKGGLPTVSEFCREHGVDMVHAQFVAAQAQILFNALKPMHGLPGKRRRMLKLAALLNTVGATTDPDRPYRAGRDLILAQPLQNVSTNDRLVLACIVAFNRKKVRPEREPTMEALGDKQRAQVLALTALLRVAEALDFSHTQTTEIRSVEGVDADRCELVVAGPSAEMDAMRATSRANLWDKLFNQELVAVALAPTPSLEPESGEAVSPSPATMPTEAAVEPAVTVPEIPPMLADEPMSEAGRKVLYVHYTRMLANEAGTRLGEDIEALHDMRVATRRMRAAFQIFTPYFDKKTLVPFVKGLRRTGRALGAVRDLDVLLEKAQAYGNALPPDQSDSLEPLMTYWQTRREVARRQMLKYLSSKAYRQFTTDFAAFLTTPGAGALVIPPGEPVPFQVRHVVPRLIFTRYEVVRAYETVLDDPPLTTLHRLRIDCKGLRYALEFFRDVLGPETSDLIKRVVGMQNLLGELQDAHVAEGLLVEFLDQQRHKRKRRKQGSSLKGVEHYLVAQQTIQEELVADFPALWVKLVGYDFRQALSLAVAAL